ncbi:hypothetical protein [Microbacterium excoecariae]|uniref:hypothetical protein n=1 Tax=Microbacterium excoecariae TaxID=2715210 RepID=UPI00140C6F10|nr:hypothetical protein [Microbacterium excoecariae]NHI17259.1 hypothetical protein [Microbacterium excoecariae]
MSEFWSFALPALSALVGVVVTQGANIALERRRGKNDAEQHARDEASQVAREEREEQRAEIRELMDLFTRFREVAIGASGEDAVYESIWQREYASKVAGAVVRIRDYAAAVGINTASRALANASAIARFRREYTQDSAEGALGVVFEAVDLALDSMHGAYHGINFAAGAVEGRAHSLSNDETRAALTYRRS